MGPDRGLLLCKCCTFPLVLGSLALCSSGLLRQRPGRVASATQRSNWHSPLKQLGHHAAGGCNSTNATNVYDCLKDYASWEADWTPKKKEFCCHCHNLGCLKGSEKNVTPAPPVHRDACDEEGCHFYDGWHTCLERIQYHASAIRRPDACQKAYHFVQTSCCNCSRCVLGEAVRRCKAPASRIPGAAVAPASIPTNLQQRKALFNCQAEYARRETRWSESKKLWCCTYEEIGCLPNTTQPTQSPAAQTAHSTAVVAADETIAAEKAEPAAAAAIRMLACSRTCVFEGLSASCSHRIVYAAQNKFQDKGIANGCVFAQELVLRQCPACSACALADTGCETRAPGTTTDVAVANLTTTDQNAAAL